MKKYDFLLPSMYVLLKKENLMGCYCVQGPHTKDRKPLTQVQGFNLHVDYRFMKRAQFDEKGN